MTVAELEHRMSNAEFVRWQVHYARVAQRRQHEHLQAESRSKARRR